jgi:hypothetical protein
MRRLMHLAAWLYPRRWRDRYAAEFHALIDDVPPRWAALFDVIRGGVSMRMKSSNPALMAASLGILGAVLGGIGALAAPVEFESRGRMVAIPVGDRAAVDTVLLAALGRAVESEFGTGTDERRKVAVVKTGQSNELQVSFLDPDPRRAQQVAQAVMTRTIQAHLDAGESAASRASGVQLKIVMPPDLPESPARRNQVWLIGAGFGGGAMIGLVVGVIRRRSDRPAR